MAEGENNAENQGHADKVADNLRENISNSVEKIEEARFGPWMLAKRTGRRYQNARNQENQTNHD